MKNTMKLSYCALGISVGATWALGVFLLGIGNMLFTGWGTSSVVLLSEVYIGFGASIVGAIIGAVWGFVDGFIGGVIVAFIYNYVLKCCDCKSCKDVCTDDSASEAKQEDNSDSQQ